MEDRELNRPDSEDIPTHRNLHGNLCSKGFTDDLSRLTERFESVQG